MKHYYRLFLISVILINTAYLTTYTSSAYAGSVSRKAYLESSITLDVGENGEVSGPDTYDVKAVNSDSRTFCVKAEKVTTGYFNVSNTLGYNQSKYGFHQDKVIVKKDKGLCNFTRTIQTPVWEIARTIFNVQSPSGSYSSSTGQYNKPTRENVWSYLSLLCKGKESYSGQLDVEVSNFNVSTGAPAVSNYGSRKQLTVNFNCVSQKSNTSSQGSDKKLSISSPIKAKQQPNIGNQSNKVYAAKQPAYKKPAYRASIKAKQQAGSSLSNQSTTAQSYTQQKSNTSTPEISASTTTIEKSITAKRTLNVRLTKGARLIKVFVPDARLRSAAAIRLIDSRGNPVAYTRVTLKGSTSRGRYILLQADSKARAGSDYRLSYRTGRGYVAISRKTISVMINASKKNMVSPLRR